MPDLNKTEKEQIRFLVESSQWQTLERLANLLCSKIRENSPLGDSEWETLKNVFMREGEVQGIKKFLQEIQNQISK